MGDTPTPPCFLGVTFDRRMHSADAHDGYNEYYLCIHRMHPPIGGQGMRSGGSPLFKFIAITRFTDEFIINAYDFIGTFIPTIMFLTFITYF